MIQKTVALLALLLWPVAAAHASITEIRKDFLNETSLLPATPIMTAPAANANYLICVSAGDVQAGAPTAILRWTDENGQFRNFTYATKNGVPNGCAMIRNQADTAATIETDGTYSGFYDLFAFGFGFWPEGTQSQGGIKEPLAYAVNGANGNGHEFSFPGYPWLFSVVTATNCQWELSGGWSGAISGTGSQVSTGFGGGNGTFTTSTADCGYTLIAVQFGDPAPASNSVFVGEWSLAMSLQEFSLPTTITIVGADVNGKKLAHCLDFDLIETADTEEEALSRLTRTIKSYVEFGLGKGWEHCIRHRAPQRFWDAVTEEMPVRFGPPIKIANVTVPVIKVEEPGYEALAAAGQA